MRPLSAHMSVLRRDGKGSQEKEALGLSKGGFTNKTMSWWDVL